MTTLSDIEALQDDELITLFGTFQNLCDGAQGLCALGVLPETTLGLLKFLGGFDRKAKCFVVRW